MEQRAKAEAAAKQAQARQAAVQEQARQAAAQTQQNQKLNVVFKREQVAKPTATSGDGTDSANKTVRKTAKQKVGRNDPCPCGSGKKYKKCCGRDE
nr:MULTISPECIES: SEC-C metal-binding domain-containing protein [unclassified Ruminococcus]